MTPCEAPRRPALRVVPASERVRAEVAALVAGCPTGDGCPVCAQAVADLAELERLARATATIEGMC